MQQMFDAHPETKYANDINVDAKFEDHSCMHCLIALLIQRADVTCQKIIHSADVGRSMGGDVWLDPRTALNHVGHYTFRGNIRKLFTGENDKPVTKYIRE